MVEQNGTELSEREKEILKLVATGASNKNIAQRLVISPNTVKVHLRNIFSKIGVASRTEATLYAIRSGLTSIPVATEGGMAEVGAIREITATVSPAADTLAVSSATRPPVALNRRWIVGSAIVLGLVIVMLALTAPRWIPVATPVPPLMTVTAVPRWQVRANLPTARSGLAAATFENRIYAIAGEGAAGPTNIVERYDPATNQWQALPPKPTAVADVQAAVVGGHIFVPGGRLASGAVTDILEVYDPRDGHWEIRASMPVGVSGYALVAFEGKLYLFGGWDGQAYTGAVHAYDPVTDKWTSRTPMPSARGLTGAAVAGNRIYVIGGTDGQQALTLNMEYEPSVDNGKTPAPESWRSRAPLPSGRQGLGAASVADLIVVIGGKASSGILQYVAKQNAWYELDSTATHSLTQPGLASAETQVYVIGGQNETQKLNTNMTYQILFTVLMPIIQQ